MNSQNNNFISTQIERMKKMNTWFNVDQDRAIETLKAFSKIIFLFTLLFLGALIVKAFQINDDSLHFRLVLSNIDILPLFKQHFVTFVCMVAYEVVRLLVAAILFYYFIQFLNSLDKRDPFKHAKSRFYIMIVATCSSIFFAVDAIGMMHLAYVQDELLLKESLRIFHFEYLFIAYFLNVFAFVFKRGVDLNDEIDLVI